MSQIPSLPACIHHVAQLLPLEEIYRIPKSKVESDVFAAKKTWREPREQNESTEETAKWTAGAIMEGRATKRGYC